MPIIQFYSSIFSQLLSAFKIAFGPETFTGLPRTGYNFLSRFFQKASGLSVEFLSSFCRFGFSRFLLPSQIAVEPVEW